jgi:Na+/H+-translocating membrane pyrophosphatase
MLPLQNKKLTLQTHSVIFLFCNKRSKIAKAGVNIWTTEKVGIKLQASLLSVVQAVGGGLYFATGGVGAGVSGLSAFFQFVLGSGLVFKLGK